MNPTPQRALVTGGTGFIGAHLVKALLDRGAVVTVLARPSSDDSRLRALAGPAIERASIKRVDLTSATAVREAVADARPDTIFHAAGDVRARAPIEDEPAMIALHAKGAGALADAGALAGARRLVALSTSDVYGHLPSPADPDGPLDPKTPYARSKAEGEASLLERHRRGDIDVVILRPYIVYGPTQAGPQLIPAVIRACLEARVMPMTDGTQRRDFVFVDDVVRAILRAGEAEGAGGRAIDVCSGSATRVAEVVALIVGAARPREGGPVLGATPRPPHEPDERFGDPNGAAAILGFRADVSLAEGIARTVAATKAMANQ